MMKFPRLIGVIHLPPLPGSPASHGHHPADCLQSAGALAVQEAQMLVNAGYDGIILENFGDAPFFPTSVSPETIASMSIIAAAVRESAGRIQLGINVLRNDAAAALAVAAVTGCDFIRVNVLTGVAATDQGWIEGCAAQLMRERDRLHAPVAVLADVHVKHATTISSSEISLAVEEAVIRGMADGVIVSGKTTGRLIDSQSLHAASRAARELGIPIFLGSGASREHLAEIKPWVDGIIVGSALRKDGIAGAPLDKKQVTAFLKDFDKIRVRKGKLQKK